MKRLLFIFGFLFGSYLGFGQKCFTDTDGIDFYRQGQIDSFSINYPNCTEIDGNLGVHFLDDLSGLKQITSVKNYVVLKGDFKNFDGLSNLEYVGVLEIENADKIVDFSGLENLKSVYERIHIHECDRLESLKGLGDITKLYSLAIDDNPNLITLDGLNRYLSIVFDISVRYNPKLEDCYQMCDFAKKTQYYRFEYNGLGCNNNEIDTTNCGKGIIGNVFYDLNENGKFDQNEFGIPNQSIEILPLDLDLFTNKFGKYHIPVFENIDYNIRLKSETNFKVTTDSAYVLDLDELSSFESLQFGIVHNSDLHQIETNISSTSPRCFEDVEFNLKVTNTGSFVENGHIIIRFDNETLFTGKADPLPSKIDETKNLLYYSFQGLEPFETRVYRFYLEVPGIESINNFISNSGFVYHENNGDSLLLAHTNLREQIKCSYDPNDKTAFPFGVQDEHYTLKDDTLSYMVRFQNTGNAEAYNIKIRDTLSHNFNWNTLKILNASHSVRSEMNRNGVVTFFFDDIFLPDSTSNPAGSQGYVTYEIQHKKNLPENTIIENTAYIYFDYNPAIVTNTTFNTMVTEIPIPKSDLSELSEIYVYPNPTSDFFYFALTIAEDIDINLLDITGKLLKTYSYQDSGQYSLSGLGQGLYFITVYNKRSKDIIGYAKVLKN